MIHLKNKILNRKFDKWMKDKNKIKYKSQKLIYFK